MRQRTLEHKTTLTAAACILAALALLVAALWGQAALRGQKMAGFVESHGVWTRFGPPVLEQGKGSDHWMVPCFFTYQVDGNGFSGREMMHQSNFADRKPQVGQDFVVWYDPQNPSDVVRSRRKAALDAGLLRWMMLVTGGCAAGLGLLAVRAHRAGGTGDVAA